MDKDRKIQYNPKIIRLILVEKFSFDDMYILATDLCGNHELVFSKDAKLELAANDLVQWSRRHSQINKLVELIRERRPAIFEEYKAKLEQPDNSHEGILEDIQASSSSIKETFDQIRVAGNVSKSQETENISACLADHPLSRDQAAVKLWFRDELSIDEQAFVISVALFSGLQRYELFKITSVVRSLLKPSQNGVSLEKSSGIKPGEDESSLAKENVVNLRISLNQGETEVIREKEANKKSEKVIEDEGRLLDLANLVTETTTRNTESGETNVRIIQFCDETQRQKIILLLANNFTGIIWKLIPCIYTLGADPRAEVRARTARTVGELLREVDFIRIKDELLIPWALSPRMDISINVGIALEEAIKNGQYIDNAKNLLKHWVTSSNPDLIWTSLACYFQLCHAWPKEAIDAIRSAIRKDINIAFLPLCCFIARELCKNGHNEDVIRSIAEWMREEKGENNLRFGAALIFIDTIDFTFLVNGIGFLDKVVEIYRIGLSDRSLDNLGIIRAAMLEKLGCWAEESFGKDSQEEIEMLFTRLFVRSDERGKERIKFFLEKSSRKADHNSNKRLSRGFKKIISGLPE
jgi:hypothetical protein